MMRLLLILLPFVLGASGQQGPDSIDCPPTEAQGADAFTVAFYGQSQLEGWSYRCVPGGYWRNRTCLYRAGGAGGNDDTFVRAGGYFEHHEPTSATWDQYLTCTDPEVCGTKTESYRCGTFGPFARLYEKLYNKPFLGIASAQGSTCYAYGCPPRHWNPDDPGPLWTSNVLGQNTELDAQPADWTPDVCVWHIGESDAGQCSFRSATAEVSESLCYAKMRDEATTVLDGLIAEGCPKVVMVPVYSDGAGWDRWATEAQVAAGLAHSGTYVAAQPYPLRGAGSGAHYQDLQTFARLLMDAMIDSGVLTAPTGYTSVYSASTAFTLPPAVEAGNTLTCTEGSNCNIACTCPGTVAWTFYNGTGVGEGCDVATIDNAASATTFISGHVDDTGADPDCVLRCACTSGGVTISDLVGVNAVGAGATFPAPGTASILATNLDAAGHSVCSEPLNWLEGSGTGLSGPYDPTDSEGLGALECDDVFAANWDTSETAGSTPDIDTEGLRPTGTHADYNYLYKFDIGATTNQNDGMDVRGKAFSTTDGTFCMWKYEAMSADVVFDDSGERMKVMDLFWSGGELQLEWNYDGSGKLRPQMPPSGGFGEGTTVDMSDCVSDLCHIQACVDYDGVELEWRVKIKSLDTGVTEDITRTGGSGPLAHTGAWAPTTVQISKMYVQQNGATTITGSRYASFAGQVLVEPNDPTFWPGPEAEVEGCGELLHGACP